MTRHNTNFGDWNTNCVLLSHSRSIQAVLLEVGKHQETGMKASKFESLIDRIRQNDVTLTTIPSDKYRAEQLRSILTEINLQGDASHVTTIDLRDSWWRSNYGTPKPYAESLVEFIKTNRTVKSLYLQNCAIGDHLVEIAEAIKDNRSLILVDFGGNHPADENEKAVASALADMLKGNKTLEILRLSKLKLQDSSLKILEEALIDSVCEIDLSSNQLGIENSKAFDTLANVLIMSKKLEVLLLDNTQMTEKTLISQLARGVEGTSSLRRLGLSFMRKNDPIAAWNDLFSSIAKNSSIEDLNMPFNCLESDAGLFLQEMLTKNSTLKTLDLRNVGMSSTVFSHLCVGMKRNRALKCLMLSSLPFEGGYWTHDFYSFLECNTSLEKLYFAGNKFGERGIPNLCNALSLNSSLTFLDFSHCFQRLENVLQLLAVALKDNLTLSTLLLHNNIFLDGDIENGLTTLIKDNRSLTTLGLKTEKVPPKHFVQAIASSIKENNSLVQIDLNPEVRWTFQDDSSIILAKTQENKLAQTQNAKFLLFAKLRNAMMDYKWTVSTIFTMVGPSCYRLQI
jgi:Ran GTPase-activating protein (RanGAP) involved in mRNA processing and transport